MNARDAVADGEPGHTAVDYVVLSNIVVDDIVLPNGSERRNVLGGAATWAALGIRFWSSSVGMVSGMGEDFADAGREWFDANAINLDGVTVRDAHSPHTWVRYAPDGERVETPQYGEAHFRTMESSAEQIPPHYRNARGLYIFRSHAPDFWASMRALPAAPAQVILWEIAANSAQATLLPQVAEAFALVDLFSINRTEAYALCGVNKPVDALHMLLEAGARVVALRMGSEGSMVTDGVTLLEIPSAPAQVVDVTGGGNAWSGGFLAGWCGAAERLATTPLERAARCAAVSAAIAIAQYGPPPLLNDRLLHDAYATAEKITIIRSAFR
jgi:sugar/nucleoside kinase (ribokinase family)